MRTVVCSLGMSVDGYAMGPDGSFDWAGPDDELFRFATDEVRQLDVHLMGRRLYETMRYWDSDDVVHTDLEREFADLWRSLTKVVFSTTLASVDAGYELAQGTPADEISRWRAQPGEGGIAVGGPTLTAQVADLGLVDEYALRVFPVLVGGGTPFFARSEQRVDLELVASRSFDAGVVHHRYRVVR